LIFHILNEVRPVIDSHLVTSLYQTSGQLFIKSLKAAVTCGNATGAEESDVHKTGFMREDSALIPQPFA
jgi:hypothetical protein